MATVGAGAVGAGGVRGATATVTVGDTDLGATATVTVGDIARGVTVTVGVAGGVTVGDTAGDRMSHAWSGLVEALESGAGRALCARRAAMWTQLYSR